MKQPSATVTSKQPVVVNDSLKKVGASSNQLSLASSTAKTGTNAAAKGFAASW